MPNQSELYYETYREDESEEELSPRKKLFRTTARVCGLLLVAAILGIFFWRIWMVKEPRSMTEYLYTEAALAEEKLTVVTRDLDQTYLATDEEGNSTYISRSDGYFYTGDSDYDGCMKVSAVQTTAETGGVQFAFRFSERVIPAFLRYSYGIGYQESADYPFTLALMTADGTLYTEYDYTEGRRGYLNYRKLIFEGIPESDLLYLNVYYNGVVFQSDRPLASIVIYDVNLKSSEVKLPALPAAPAALLHAIPPEETK